MKFIKIIFGLLLWIILFIPATILFFLVGWDMWEYFCSKYGILPMRLPK